MTSATPSRPRLLLPTLVFALLVLGSAACNRTPAGGPCTIDASAQAGPPDWPSHPVDGWRLTEIPQPPGSWVGSLAVSPDGRQAAYTNAIGGDFIRTTDSVTLIRVDLAAQNIATTANVTDLPGKALRNHANLDWSRWGLAYASWTTLGIANPRTEWAKALYTLPSEGPKRPTFPLFSSVGWTPGGDCVIATIERQEGEGALVAWKAAGAKSESHRRTIEHLERIAGWVNDQVVLVRTTGGGVSARTLDPITGHSVVAPEPPAEAQASAWLAGWTWIDAHGRIWWRPGTESGPPRLVARVPKVLEAPKQGAGTADGEATHRFLRLIPAESGRAVVVEEGVNAPGVHRRHVHVLTPRG